VEFTCKLRGEIHRFKVNVPGVHNVYNALVSIAVGDIFGLTPEEMGRGILNFKPGKLRMDVIALKDGIRIINDCYNANPDSMKAALDVLHSYGGNRKIAVLGDMFELGSFSENAHREIGRYLINKCDMLIAVGEQAKYMVDEADNHVECYYFRTKEEACLQIDRFLKANDVLLIKASRGMNMEIITNYLVECRKGNGNAD
jgi:UDP-N-acetylmuramyl pentapeptide synthase